MWLPILTNWLTFMLSVQLSLGSGTVNFLSLNFCIPPLLLFLEFIFKCNTTIPLCLSLHFLQRPSGDEVITLQNQLSTAQQQVASLRQEKEEEHKSWQEKFNATLTEVNRCDHETIKDNNVLLASCFHLPLTDSLWFHIFQLTNESKGTWSWKSSKNRTSTEVNELSRWGKLCWRTVYFLFWNIWLVSDVTWFDSLQTAVTASTENRKQAQEQNQEQQRNLINLQHDLSQVGAKLGYSTCSRNDHRESNNYQTKRAQLPNEEYWKFLVKEKC